MQQGNNEFYSVHGSKVNRRSDAIKTFRKILISTAILIVIFLIGGLIYAFFTSGNDNSHSKVQAKINTDDSLTSKELVAKPTKPADNAPEGVAVYLASPSVKAGSNVSVSARTVAGSACTITAVYNGVPSRESGLSPKPADDYGGVNWTWTVERTVPPGSWPVKVTCVYHGRTGVAQGMLQVVK